MKRTERRRMEKKDKMRKLSMKISTIFVTFSLVFGLVISVFSYYMAEKSYVEFYSTKLQQSVAFVASQVDGEKIKEYYETKKTDKYYDDLKTFLSEIKATHDISYLYIFVPDDNHFTYIVEAQLETDDAEYIASLGDEYDYTELEYKHLVPDINAKKASDRVIRANNDLSEFGQGVSAWAPITDKQGDLVAMVEGDITIDRVIQTMRRYVAVIIAITALLIVMLVFVLTLAVRRMITRPLAKLTGRVQAFAQDGNLNEFIDDIRTRDEMQTLSQAFGTMAKDIDTYTKTHPALAAEKERISAELDLATHIQVSMFPSTFPPFPNRSEFSIYATMQPAKEVGGDFYDFFMIDEDHLAVVIADVSGKGVPAALFMVITKTLIKNYTQEGNQPSRVFTSVNTQLCENNDAGMFVTAWMGILEISTGKFTYVNAGHNHPLLKKADGSFEYLKCRSGFILAGMEGTKYRQYEINLEKGDTLYLYTDGVTEATNTQEQLYGDQRLKEILDKNSEQPLDDLLDSVKNDIDLFVNGGEQFDDITMLALRIMQ